MGRPGKCGDVASSAPLPSSLPPSFPAIPCRPAGTCGCMGMCMCGASGHVTYADAWSGQECRVCGCVGRMAGVQTYHCDGHGLCERVPPIR
eukprot:363874-Chlamydomonas_euryale.AAC.3